jgi:hypothetical protein
MSQEYEEADEHTRNTFIITLVQISLDAATRSV